MKKIIALSGKAESGKTTTLNILINLLSIVSDSFEISREYDSMATFTFNDTIISVCTPGDTGDILQENIDYFEEQKCDVCVSAIRTKGAGWNLYKEFAKKNNLEILKIFKDDDKTSCRLYAANLFQMVTSEIDIEVKEVN